MDRLVEPFAGSAAVTLAVAHAGLAHDFAISDGLQPLADLWSAIVKEPQRILTAYDALWHEQVGQQREYYLHVRKRFNDDRDPADFMFLMARCVKGAIRFNTDGDFNQSADHRRMGMRPVVLRKQICGAHSLLRGRTTVTCSDYADILNQVRSQDVVYMDPPYQGVSGSEDQRYYEQLDLNRFVSELESLNQRDIRYIVSFDGFLGNQEYGTPLPTHLNLKRLLVAAGRSTQATLSGRSDKTVESLYVSANLAMEIKHTSNKPERERQLVFFQ